MKIVANFLVILFVAGLFSSCDKEEEIINTPTEVGHSRVTYFVDLTLTGDPIVSIPVGGSFTDPGAVATENGQPVDVTVDGQIDNSQVGLYTVNYTAINKDGFPKSVSRLVFVTPGPEVAGTDLSGSYSLVGASLISTVTKVAPGVYQMDNLNHPLTPISWYLISSNGLDITFPVQATPYGDLDGSGTYDPATKKAVWTINIPSQAYTRTRTFIKQ